MRHIVNEERIARGARLGKIATFVGLGFLVGGLVISLVLQDTPLIWTSFICLLLGLLVSSVGTMNMSRWVREPRADQALAKALKGFDDRYQLYSYDLPASQVLLCPMGLFAITALGQEGVIRYDGDKFHRDFNLGRAIRFMAEEGMGKPLADADSEVKDLKKFLEENDVGQDVEVDNILVFFNPGAQLEISDPPRPIIIPKALKKTLRKQKDKGLSNKQYREIEEALDAAVEAS